MSKMILLFALLLSGCDMIMETDVKQIPDSFEVEEFIYVHGRFPDCYSSVSRITEQSAAAFVENKDDFRYSEYQNRKYRAWTATPIPEHYLSEDAMENSIIILNVIESGVSCFEGNPESIDKYEDIYWKALSAKGSHYTFAESSHHVFMLYIPSERLLIHTIR